MPKLETVIDPWDGSDPSARGKYCWKRDATAVSLCTECDTSECVEHIHHKPEALEERACLERAASATA